MHGNVELASGRSGKRPSAIVPSGTLDGSTTTSCSCPADCISRVHNRYTRTAVRRHRVFCRAQPVPDPRPSLRASNLERPFTRRGRHPEHRVAGSGTHVFGIRSDRRPSANCNDLHGRNRMDMAADRWRVDTFWQLQVRWVRKAPARLICGNCDNHNFPTRMHGTFSRLEWKKPPRRHQTDRLNKSPNPHTLQPKGAGCIKSAPLSFLFQEVVFGFKQEMRMKRGEST